MIRLTTLALIECLMSITNVFCRTPDTLWMSGCDKIFEGSPERFFLTNIPGREEYWLQSELYRYVILDSNLQVISRQPTAHLLDQGKRLYDFSHIALGEDLWVEIDFHALTFAHPISEDKGCHKTPFYLGRSKQNPYELSPDYQIGNMQNGYLRKIGENSWNLYLSKRMIFPSPGVPSLGCLPPVFAIRIEKKAKKFTVSIADIAFQGIPVNYAVKTHDYLYGLTDFAVQDEELWVANQYSPMVYAMGLDGSLHDSIIVGSPNVMETAIYVPPSYKEFNSRRLDKEVNQFYHILCSDGYLIRNIYLAPGEQRRFVVYDFSKGMEKEFAGNNGKGVTSIINGKAVFPGVKVGDRIAFPCLDLEEIMNE